MKLPIDQETPAFIGGSRGIEDTDAFRVDCAAISPRLRQYVFPSNAPGCPNRGTASDFMLGNAGFQLCRVYARDDKDRTVIRYVVVRLVKTGWDVLTPDLFAPGIEDHHPRASIAFAATNPKARQFDTATDAVRAAVEALRREVA